MRSRPKAPTFTSIVYHHHIPLFKGSSSSPMAISTIYYDWIKTHASKAKPWIDHQQVPNVWDQQDYWQGPWKCIPGKSRSRWKPESDPEEAKSGLAVAGSTLAALSTYDSNSRRVKTRYNPYHAQGKGLANREINHPKMEQRTMRSLEKNESLLCMMLLPKS